MYRAGWGDAIDSTAAGQCSAADHVAAVVQVCVADAVACRSATALLCYAVLRLQDVDGEGAAAIE